MRISDWSSDVCSSDLQRPTERKAAHDFTRSLTGGRAEGSLRRGRDGGRHHMVLRLRSHRGSAFLRRDAQPTVTQFTRTTALRALAAGTALLALAACSSKPDRVENATACPDIRVPDEAGEVTRFRPGGAVDLTDIA